MDVGQRRAGDGARARAGCGARASPGETTLTLQLLPEPRRISVSTARRRDDEIPRAFRDEKNVRKLVQVAGPDRVSGSRWDEPYAREYFRCVAEDGGLVWLYRDARDGAWYLHGWWD